MKAVILGKASSRRVPYKNYRAFYQDLSLTDILLEKLTRVIRREDIYLSCEEPEYRKVAKKWGISFIHRDRKYTLLETNTVEVVRGVGGDGVPHLFVQSGLPPSLPQTASGQIPGNREQPGHG